MPVEGKEQGKRSAALKAIQYVKPGMLLGLGTGTTTAYFVDILGEQVAQGLKVRGIPTSRDTEDRARKLRIEIASRIDGRIDIDFDGADEVDSMGNLVKGGGGALTREKIVAENSRNFFVLVDESKLTKGNLKRSKIPVEVLPFLHESTARKISALARDVILREGFVTDNGNYIVDCYFNEIENPADLEKEIKMLPGVVEVGLFIGLASKIIVGREDGTSYEINTGSNA